MEYNHCLNEFKKSLLGGSEKEITYDTIINQISTNRIRWLDVGIGDGKYLNKIIQNLKENGFKIDLTGIDISKKALELAKKRFPKAKLIPSKFSNAKLEEKYDVIHLSQSLYYLGDKKSAIKKLANHLAEGGLLIIVLWSEKDALYKLHKEIFSTKTNSTFTAEKTFKLLLNFKEFNNIKKLYFQGRIDFSRWKTSNAKLHQMINIISRIPVNGTRADPPRNILENVKKKLKYADTGKRINGIIVAKKSYDIKNFNKRSILYGLKNKFPSYAQNVAKLSGDLEALFMASWQKETDYLSKQFSSGRILEIGCGAGFRSVIFAKRHKVIAIESNKKRISFAKKNVRLFGYANKIQFICKDASNLKTLKGLGEFSAIFVDTDWRENLKDPLKKHSINPFKTNPKTDVLYKNLRKLFPKTPIIFKVSPFSKVEEMRNLGKCKIEELHINNKFLAYNVYFSPKIKTKQYLKVSL